MGQQIFYASLPQHVDVHPFEFRILGRGFAQRRVGLDCCLAGENGDILPIPPINSPIFADKRPNQVEYGEALLREKVLPKLGPLFVDMTGPALPRHRSGKENNRGQLRQTTYQATAGSRGQMLCDLETCGEVEALVDLKWLRQIDGTEKFGGNIQLRPIHIIAVDSPNY